MKNIHIISYIPSFKKYIGAYHFFEEEELALFDQLSEEYNPNFPSNEIQWLEIFPEFKSHYKKLIKEQIKTLELHLQNLLKNENGIKQKLVPWLDKNTTQWYEAMLQNFTDVRTQTLQTIKRLAFQFSILNKPNKEELKSNNNINDVDIVHAKDVPIVNFYPGTLQKMGKLLVGRCEFHNERTGSFTIYPNNSWYCYGCTLGGDSIAYIQRKQNINFIEAVKFLTNK